MTLLPKRMSSTKSRMVKFAIHGEETIEYERHLYIQEAGEEHQMKEDSHERLISYLRANCRINIWSIHLKFSL